MMRYLYGLGYYTYMHDLSRPIELHEWTDEIIPLMVGVDGRGFSGKRTKVHSIKEVFIIHKDVPIPLILNSTGPPGGPGRSSV